MAIPEESDRATIDHPLLADGVLERRQYQLELAETASAHHTLVCLPTGLGKTTVSVIVTANRLNEVGGKALMLAPTKPLVHQHAEFYREALEIPDSDIRVLTGDTPPADRSTQWEEASVFLATPQVVENDLVGSRISLAEVTHLTFDECHRATGNYAYNYIADRYHAEATDPLVTGMSASPGDDEEAILEVCRNLGIDEIEVMTSADSDVDEYTYDTEMEWERIELPEEILAIRDLFHDVIADRLSTLKEIGVAESTDPEQSQRELNRMRGKLQQLIDAGDSEGYTGMSVHAEVMKLRQAVTLVETQSVDALERYLERQRNQARSSGASKASQRMMTDPRVREARRRATEFDQLHPKYRSTRILLAEALGVNDGERAIVFTESRDTAETLTEFLEPSFDVRRFVGQGDREGSDGMSQAEQQTVLEAFRAGEFDVLVSTSVAEEGLDVPEVDLVLFYEPVPTAIRSIQRKGRTGRQSAGRVVVLMAEDTRDEAYFWISKRREDQMERELRSLKGIEAEIETALAGVSDEDTADDTVSSSNGSDRSVESDDEEVQSGLDAFTAEEERSEPPTPVPTEASEETVEIVADQAEMDADIARSLSSRDDVTVRLETLPVGDYVLSDRVVVERKTTTDFVDSLVQSDRSIFQQVREMVEYYTRPVVLIEGEGLYEQRDVHPNAVRGAIASLAIDFDASVLYAESQEDTTELLAIIASREQLGSGRNVSVHGEKGAKTLAEQQEYVVSSIADIGPVTAKTLLEAFDSVEAVMTASEDALLSVDGIGEVTAGRIRDVVGSSYSEE